MKNSLPEEFRDPAWRRGLTAGERTQLEAWLAQHPEARRELADETALTRALLELSDVPVASNFTASIVEQIELAERHAQRDAARAPWWRLRAWLPRAAVAILTLGLAGTAWHRHRVAQRAEVVTAMAAGVAVLPPEAFVDFEAVKQLGDGSAPADLRLLAYLE